MDNERTFSGCATANCKETQAPIDNPTTWHAGRPRASCGGEGYTQPGTQFRKMATNHEIVHVFSSLGPPEPFWNVPDRFTVKPGIQCDEVESPHVGVRELGYRHPN